MFVLKLSFILAIFYIYEPGQIYAYTAGLRCISCTSYDAKCSAATMTDLTGINTEPCNGRCYVRVSLTGVITRGCDSGVYYSSTETILDNGCVNRNGELWCYCSTLPVGTSLFPCNYLSQSALYTNGIIDRTLGIAISCVALNCLNGGVCSNCNALVGQYYCQCPQQYTGPYCDIKMV